MKEKARVKAAAGKKREVSLASDPAFGCRGTGPI